MDAFEGWVFSSMKVSQGIFCVTFLWVCCLFSCTWILITYLFQIYYGLCGNNYILFCNFPYKWYRSYNCVVVTLDWIHGNAWEVKRKGKIYDWFIADLKILGLLLWWDVKRFGHVKLLDKRVFRMFHLNEGFRG